jgi:hypothetical protein
MLGFGLEAGLVKFGLPALSTPMGCCATQPNFAFRKSMEGGISRRNLLWRLSKKMVRSIS